MEHLLNQTCRIYHTPTTGGEFGTTTYGGSNVVACRSVRTMKYGRDSQGNDLGINLGINLKLQIAGRTVDIGTKVDFESRSYIVMSVRDWRGYDGELFGSLIYLANYAD